MFKSHLKQLGVKELYNWISHELKEILTKRITIGTTIGNISPNESTATTHCQNVRKPLIFESGATGDKKTARTQQLRTQKIMHF